MINSFFPKFHIFLRQSSFSDRSLAHVLWLLGFLVRAVLVWKPRDLVFDEVHWARFFSSYFSGQYYFDIHPPLGKLLYALWAWMFGFDSTIILEPGLPYPEGWQIILRILPVIAGSMLPPLLFCIARGLGLRQDAALLLGIMVALDGALITISRFMLLDPLLMFFGFGALYAHQRWLNSRGPVALLLAGFLAGLAFSIKWTGLSFMGFILLREVACFSRSSNNESLLYRLLFRFGCLILLPCCLYLAQFAIHFSLLPYSGPGDAFMTPAFQSGLQGNPFFEGEDVSALGFFQRFFELNHEMFEASARLKATHPYSSKWFTWPLMLRPICFWYQSSSAQIYLLGSPLIWWASSVFVLSVLQWSFLPRFRQMLGKGVWLGLMGWSLNFLPFIGIGRVMFLYHYLPALIFSMLLMLAVLDSLPHRPHMLWTLMAAVIVCFVYYSPVIYGFSAPWVPFLRQSWV